MQLYNLLAEEPGVAREKKKLKKKLFKIKLEKMDFLPITPPATHECPQKNRSSRLAGYAQHIYECLVLLYRNNVVAL